MVINPSDAKRFIVGYTSLLTEIQQLAGGDLKLGLMDLLQSARTFVVADPSLIETAIANLDAVGLPLPEEVIAAVRSLKVQRWIYLRDTTKYSVIIDPNGAEGTTFKHVFPFGILTTDVGGYYRLLMNVQSGAVRIHRLHAGLLLHTRTRTPPVQNSVLRACPKGSDIPRRVWCRQSDYPAGS